ncbi:hypothetical protein D3C80_1208500 [compost metagenome]
MDPRQQVVFLLLQQPEAHRGFPAVAFRLGGYSLLHDFFKRTVRFVKCLKIIHLVPGFNRPVKPGLLLKSEEHKRRTDQHIQQYNIEKRQKRYGSIHKGNKQDDHLNAGKQAEPAPLLFYVFGNHKAASSVAI